MKSRQQKLNEYETKYSMIPKNLEDRLKWMYDNYPISENKQREILEKRDRMLQTLAFKDLYIVLYEDPEGAARPRTRLINRKNLANIALSNPSFIHIYSPNAAQDHIYMRRLVEQSEILSLNNLIYTPCDVDYCVYFKTPSYYSRTDLYLCELGYIRPVTKPDWDNLGKKYSDMYNANIWLDDTLVVDGSVHKFYSILPRIEIRLKYLNMLYSKHQYNQINNRIEQEALYFH